MNFLSNFIKSAKHTGAVAQSSKFLAREMIKQADLNNIQTIVELGPGMGAITKQIIERMPSGIKLFTCEINGDFVSHLNKKFPEAEHIHSGIDNLSQLLYERGVEKADVLISGIPFTNFKKKEREKMFKSIQEVMHKDSRLVLFTYSPIRFGSFFSAFQKVNISYVPLNIPPAYVVTLRKK
ncbi:MAG: methyltransferase [Candidatus Moranbacteria bacterium]|nr:methyltransferase [Candidatus Moranbacteria bacterium]